MKRVIASITGLVGAQALAPIGAAGADRDLVGSPLHKAGSGSTATICGVLPPR